MSGTSAKSGKYHYYVCSRYYLEGTGECSGIRVQKSRLEDFVVMQIRERILTPDNLRELTRMVNEELREGSNTAGDRLDAVRSELEALNRRLDRHYEALETGALSISYSSERIRELKSRIDDLKSAEFGLLEDLDMTSFKTVSESDVLSFADDLRRTLAEGDVQQSKLFLASFIEKVCVDEQKVEIQYRLPTASGTSEQADFASVLQTVPQGGAWGTECRTRSCVAAW